MAGPNMTWLTIGIAAFIMIVILGSNVYVDFMTSNEGGSVDSTYSANYAEIAGYQDEISSLESSLTSNFSIWTNVPSYIDSGFNVLAIGISGVSTFLSVLTFFPSMLSNLGEVLGIPSIVIWFLTTIAGIFIITKIYQAIKGQADQS